MKPASFPVAIIVIKRATAPQKHSHEGQEETMKNLGKWSNVPALIGLSPDQGFRGILEGTRKDFNL